MEQPNPSIIDRVRPLSQLEMNVAGRKHRLARILRYTAVQSLFDAVLAGLELFWHHHLKDLLVRMWRSVARFRKHYKQGGLLLYLARSRKSPFEGRLSKD